MKRQFLAAALCITAGLSAALVGKEASAQAIGVTSDTIVVGQLGPLTGPNYTFGALVMDGSDMIFNQVNEAGGIHGRKIRSIREDDQCNPQQAVSAVKKLISDHKVFLINGGGCSNASLAQRPYIEEAGVPFIVFSATNDRITVPVAKPIFRVVMKASEEGAIQARFVNSIPGVKRVAIVSQRDAWGVAKYEGFMAEAKKIGLNIVADEEMTVDTPDGTAQALKISQARPDVVVTLLFPKPTLTFLRAAHQYGLTRLPLIGHSSVSDLADLDQKLGLKGALNNFYTISLTKFAPSDDGAKLLRDNFRKYFPKAEFTQYAMWGIASAEVIVEALRRAGPQLTRERFIAAMEDLRNFETSVFPGRLSFSSTDHDGNKSGLFVRLVNGQTQVVGTSFK
jgi:branched-chain amino acid transport system substrate-binding protein